MWKSQCVKAFWGIVALALLPTAQTAVAETTLDVYRLILHRGSQDNVVFLPGLNGAPSLTSDRAFDFGRDYSFGGRLATDLSPRTSIEASGFYTRHNASFETEDIQTSARSGSLFGDWSFISVNSSWTGTVAAFGDYSTEFYGADVSYKVRNDAGLTFKFGPRAAVLDEAMNLFAVDGGGLRPLSLNEPAGQMNIRVKNRLIGLQAGFGGSAPVFGSFAKISGNVTAGLFANFVSKDVRYQDLEVAVAQRVRQFSSDERHLSAIIEADLELAFLLGPNAELFVGGTGMLITGVATGPGNFPSGTADSDFNQIDAGDRVYYAGAKAGIRIKF